VTPPPLQTRSSASPSCIYRRSMGASTFRMRWVEGNRTMEGWTPTLSAWKAGSRASVFHTPPRQHWTKLGRCRSPNARW